MHYTYLAIDLGAILVPLLATFHPRLQFYKKWPILFPALFLSGGIFICWDIYFTSIHVWGFNDAYITGLHIFSLPAEEVFFFLCIPYACIFSYHCLKMLWPGFKLSQRTSAFISWIMMIGGISITIFFSHYKYPATTFLLLTIFIWYSRKRHWIGNFYLCYGIMLIPFVIVNGLLTGSWIAEPIVWYNNNEIIGLRILTIPVEDIFYGLLMIGSQVALYEYFAVTVGKKNACRTTI